MTKPDWANRRWGSWADFPEKIPNEKIIRTENAEVVIIGAGLAGMTAALRAAQLGADVLVIERGNKWSARGANFGVAESSFMESQGVRLDKESLVREWIKRSANRCDEKIVWQFVNNSKTAMDWLFDIMVNEYHLQPELQGAIYHGDTYREYPGSHRFFGGVYHKNGARAGGLDVVNALYTKALELGVRFNFNVRGEQLVRAEDRVTGVIASTADGYVSYCASKGVILATGDIGGNDEMCEDLSPLGNKCARKLYTPVGQNTGDGHRMGLWAGGIFEEPPFAIMVHPQSYTARNYCFLFVDQKGERYMNEDNFIQGKCLGIIKQKQKYAWSIIDSAWEEKVPLTLPYGGGIFWDHDHDYLAEWDADADRKTLEAAEKSGSLVRADTIEELAEKMGVPQDTFKATFDRYAKMVEQGKDVDFGKRKELLIPIDKAPYMALKFGPALLAVVGGLRVDETLRVVDSDLNPIQGLYAVGNVCGGRYGVDYPMLIPGNSHGSAVVFGYLAAGYITSGN